MRMVPSGTFSIRATIPATPTSWSSSGLGSSASGFFDATSASIRSPESTSLTSFMDRGRPTASGVSVSGYGTISRSGRTGAPPGPAGPAGSEWPPRRLPPRSPPDLGRRPARGARICLPSAAPPASLLGLDWNAAAGGLLSPERELDPQDSVLVGGPGRLGHRIGVQLDD